MFLLRGLRRVSVFMTYFLVPHFSILQVTSPAILPACLHPLSIPIVLLSNSLTSYTFSGYTLPYAGLTGDAFFPSSRRAREITSIKRPSVTPPTCTWCICAVYCLRIQRPTDTLLSTLLTLSSLSLSILLALCSYLFTAHVLSQPEHAPLGALLTGAMTFLVTWFCGGIVEDT